MTGLCSGWSWVNLCASSLSYSSAQSSFDGRPLGSGTRTGPSLTLGIHGAWFDGTLDLTQLGKLGLKLAVELVASGWRCVGTAGCLQTSRNLLSFYYF